MCRELIGLLMWMYCTKMELGGWGQRLAEAKMERCFGVGASYYIFRIKIMKISIPSLKKKNAVKIICIF